jgi:homoaconitase/3-isopropylmalate dehydratase large subunit
MPTSGRLVLCNMSVEAGATAGIVPPDEETLRYLRQEAQVRDLLDMVGPDADATYDSVMDVDVTDLAPQVACPHTVDNVKPVEAVEGVKLSQIVIGSCTNGRLDDLERRRASSRAQGGRGHAAAGVPGLERILAAAVESGIVLDLLRAGPS